ncbi:unnamed protein product [Polarella glacialis]|uniref:RING-type domain-containing protein n=1 Tax=Polarella glacialis TaxID=89957 RepID=A0A813GY12_POLGL|nr:unnamed protein product [Polarella glacialis]CAE8656892.1 unnamed protein product [Polarella glacialis]
MAERYCNLPYLTCQGEGSDPGHACALLPVLFSLAPFRDAVYVYAKADARDNAVLAALADLFDAMGRASIDETRPPIVDVRAFLEALDKDPSTSLAYGRSWLEPGCCDELLQTLLKVVPGVEEICKVRGTYWSECEGKKVRLASITNVCARDILFGTDEPSDYESSSETCIVHVIPHAGSVRGCLFSSRRRSFECGTEDELYVRFQGEHVGESVKSISSCCVLECTSFEALEHTKLVFIAIWSAMMDSGFCIDDRLSLSGKVYILRCVIRFELKTDGAFGTLAYVCLESKWFKVGGKQVSQSKALEPGSSACPPQLLIYEETGSDLFHLPVAATVVSRHLQELPSKLQEVPSASTTSPIDDPGVGVVVLLHGLEADITGRVGIVLSQSGLCCRVALGRRRLEDLQPNWKGSDLDKFIVNVNRENASALSKLCSSSEKLPTPVLHAIFLATGKRRLDDCEQKKMRRWLQHALQTYPETALVLRNFCKRRVSWALHNNNHWIRLNSLECLEAFVNQLPETKQHLVAEDVVGIMHALRYDGHASVRETAASAAGKLGPYLLGGPDCLLYALKHDPATQVRISACGALVQWDARSFDEDTRVHLVALLRNRDDQELLPGSDLCWHALDMVSILAISDLTALSAVMHVLQLSRPGPLQSKAALVLGELAVLEPEICLPALCRQLEVDIAESSQGFVALRLQIIEVLQRLGGAAAHLAPAAEGLSRALCRDTDAMVRIAAARALASFGPSLTGDALQALKAAMNDPDASVQRAAKASQHDASRPLPSGVFIRYGEDKIELLRAQVQVALAERLQQGPLARHEYAIERRFSSSATTSNSATNDETRNAAPAVDIADDETTSASQVARDMEILDFKPDAVRASIPETGPEDDNTCVSCVDAEAEFVMSTCGHLSYCLTCRKGAVHSDRRRRGVHGTGSSGKLKAKQYDKYMLTCPMCRAESPCVHKDKYKGQVFKP